MYYNQAYPCNPVGYYSNPSAPMVQPQYAQQIVQIADALFRSEWANCQLQQRLAQRQMAEEAYSNAGVCGDNCTTQLVRPTTC